ncbi:MAG: hypothetical protein ACFUZC_14495 [Chthoniobacteraceae bacterium]
MKLIGIVGLILGTASVVLAQTAPQPNVQFTGEALARAPEFSKWVVSYGKATPGLGGGDLLPQGGGKVVVIKTQSIIRERSTEAGDKVDKWHIGEVQYTVIPTTKQCVTADLAAFQRGVASADYYTDYSQTDFPGMEWVSEKNYVRSLKYMGRDCLVFQDTLSLYTAEELKELQKDRNGKKRASFNPADYQIPVLAYVDSQTRLPVLLQRGSELRVYRFAAPPAAMLKPPAEVLQNIKKKTEQDKELSTMPSRPF